MYKNIKKINIVLLAAVALGLSSSHVWSWKTEESRMRRGVSGAGTATMEEPFYGVGEETAITPGFAGEEEYVEYGTTRRPETAGTYEEKTERKFKGLPGVRSMGVEPSREIREEKEERKRKPRKTTRQYKEESETGTGKVRRERTEKRTSKNGGTEVTVKETRKKSRKNGNGEGKVKYKEKGSCGRCVREYRD